MQPILPADHPPDAETERLREDAQRLRNWKRWGPYLAERQWGTVREDYSGNGDAWDYFTHDQARSRAYRWGEDGLLGICDRECRLCFALGLWNGHDPILKERLFGLSGTEGNHGEDVKECYFYLDATPTHSYLKALYKYPQAEFPYDWLVAENGRRGKTDPEFELADTGIFDDSRYFDVFAEYAKAGPNDILIRITAANRGPEPAVLHVLPTLWFRNVWSWGPSAEDGVAKPSLRQQAHPLQWVGLTAEHATLGRFHWLAAPGPASRPPALLFTENETNRERLFGVANDPPYVKDAFHDYLLRGRTDAVNPAGMGTKAAAHYRLEVPAGGEVTVDLRLFAEDETPAEPFGPQFEQTFSQRLAEADAFYRGRLPSPLPLSPTVGERGRGEGAGDCRKVFRPGCVVISGLRAIIPLPWAGSRS
jgi:hypothetical protein